MNKLDFAKELQVRTKKLVIEIIRLVKKLPASPESGLIRYQLIKSGTSMGANYRAACRSRSRREFIAKLCIVVEETDETAFWLELISEIPLLRKDIVEPILLETEELLAIFIKSRQTTKMNQRNSR